VTRRVLNEPAPNKSAAPNDCPVSPFRSGVAAITGGVSAGVGFRSKQFSSYSGAWQSRLNISTAERRARSATERLAVEGRSSLRRVLGEQHQKELLRFLALSETGSMVRALSNPSWVWAQAEAVGALCCKSASWRAALSTCGCARSKFPSVAGSGNNPALMGV
jgi:hypothetical protein